MSLKASTKRTFISRLLCGVTALSRRQPWLLAVLFRCLPGSWRPQLSLGHVYWRCLLSVTVHSVTGHGWDKACCNWPPMEPALFTDYGCLGNQPCWAHPSKHRMNGWVNSSDKKRVMQLFAEPLAKVPPPPTFPKYPHIQNFQMKIFFNFIQKPPTDITVALKIMKSRKSELGVCHFSFRNNSRVCLVLSLP